MIKPVFFFRKTLFASILAVGAWAATGTHGAVSDAHRAQLSASSSLPLPLIPLCGTHNTYNAAPLPLPQQTLSIEEQLDLGARSLEFDVHALDAFGGERLRLCHGSSAVRAACELVSFGAPCSTLGVADLGRSTGCTADSIPIGDALRAVARFLRKPGNQAEVVVVRVEDYVPEAEFARINAAFEDIIGSLLFKPSALAARGGAWPTVDEMVAADTRVVVMAENSVWGGTVAHPLTRNPAFPLNYVNKFRSETCGTTSSDASVPRNFTYFFGDSMVIEYLGQMIYNGPVEHGTVTAAIAGDLLRCGFGPHFDQFDASLAASAIWSWADTEPAVPASSGQGPMCARMSLSDRRWRTESCATQSAVRAACRADAASGTSVAGATSDWAVSASAVTPAEADAGTAAAGGSVCPGGFSFATPRGPLENAALAAAAIAAGVDAAAGEVLLSLRSCEPADGQTVTNWAHAGTCQSVRTYPDLSPSPASQSPEASSATAYRAVHTGALVLSLTSVFLSMAVLS